MHTLPTKEWGGTVGKMKAVNCGAAICNNAVAEAERDGQKIGLKKALRSFNRLRGQLDWSCAVTEYLEKELKKLEVSR